MSDSFHRVILVAILIGCGKSGYFAACAQTVALQMSRMDATVVTLTS